MLFASSLFWSIWLTFQVLILLFNFYTQTRNHLFNIGNFTCVSFGLFLLQAPVVKKYPAEISLTAITMMQGTVQCTLVALIFEPKASAWKLKWGFELLSIVYSVSIAVMGSIPSNPLHNINHIMILF